MSDKVFKTYDEQLEILEGRGICFKEKSSRKKAKNIIQREGYYKLINGYKNPFLDKSLKEEKFLPGTSIDEIHALYCFDRSLREIFMKYILHVETNIKTLLSYTISEKYGHDNYLIYSNFNNTKRNAHKEIPSVIADLTQAISRNYNDPCINHYLNKYGYVPLWVLNNVLTLGNVNRLYSILCPQDRQKISKIFKIPDDNLESFLFTLSIIRNCAVHGNRLYCHRNKRPLVDTALHESLGISINHEEYRQGKRDLFAAVIALRYLLSVNEYKQLQKELQKIITKLEGKLEVINIGDILLDMGFPTNWQDTLSKGMK